jgi:hypothetical protein
MKNGISNLSSCCFAFLDRIPVYKNLQSLGFFRGGTRDIDQAFQQVLSRVPLRKHDSNVGCAPDRFGNMDLIWQVP